MKNSIIRRVVILGALATIGIMGIQTYWVLQTWDIKEKEFHQTVYIALQNVALELAEVNESTLPYENLISQTSSNYYIVNINDEIDANLLELFLRREFQSLALETPFDYGIYDCSSGEMVYGDYVSFGVATKDGMELGRQLPKYAGLDYYFGVRVPDKKSYLLGTMWLIVFFSGLLFLAILFFIYSMFVILRQKRLSEMQKDFINNMTHEFKTPISTIGISADVFINDPDIQQSDRLSRYAQIIRDQNRRLNGQVEKVLQLARIERDNFRLNLERLDLHDLLRNIIQNTEVNAARQNGVLTSNLLADEAIIEADRTHLTNILYNLLDNALKYCRDQPLIHIRTVEEDKRIVLSISDEGLGIPKEYHSKVFDKFYRVPTGNVHNVKGFGLGLFYIKNICDAHGWRIHLDSQVNEGTTIRIYIRRPAVVRSWRWTLYQWFPQFKPSSLEE